MIIFFLFFVGTLQAQQLSFKNFNLSGFSEPPTPNGNNGSLPTLPDRNRTSFDEQRASTILSTLATTTARARSASTGSEIHLNQCQVVVDACNPDDIQTEFLVSNLPDYSARLNDNAQVAECVTRDRQDNPTGFHSTIYILKQPVSAGNQNWARCKEESSLLYKRCQQLKRAMCYVLAGGESICIDSMIADHSPPFTTSSCDALRSSELLHGNSGLAGDEAGVREEIGAGLPEYSDIETTPFDEVITSNSRNDFRRLWRSLSPQQRWDILCDEGMDYLGTPRNVETLPEPIKGFILGIAQPGITYVRQKGTNWYVGEYRETNSVQVAGFLTNIFNICVLREPKRRRELEREYELAKAHAQEQLAANPTRMI